MKNGKLVTASNLLLLIIFELGGFSDAKVWAAEKKIKEIDFELTAQDIVSDIVLGWNLGNTLDAYKGTVFGAENLSSETYWGNPKAAQELLDLVIDTGINAIRVPVTWYNHIDKNHYEIDTAWMNRVEEVVKYVLKNDTYCIINVHHDTGEKGWLKATPINIEENKKIFTKIWEQISDRFNKYGDKLLFEGFNEMLDDNNEWVNPSSESVEIVNEYNQIFVDTVRASRGNNSKRVLICTSYAAAGNNACLKNFKIPHDTVKDKLIMECHLYQPFYFTSGYYPKETTWKRNKRYLDEQINCIKRTFSDKNIPVIIGEFGCSYKNNDDEINSWANYFVSSFAENNIPCFWWDEGNTYKLFNRRKLSIEKKDTLNTLLEAAKQKKINGDKEKTK